MADSEARRDASPICVTTSNCTVQDLISLFQDRNPGNSKLDWLTNA